MTDPSFYVLIDTLSYSLKGERGAPGPKGTPALVLKMLEHQIHILMMSLIKMTLHFQGILDL